MDSKMLVLIVLTLLVGLKIFVYLKEYQLKAD